MSENENMAPEGYDEIEGFYEKREGAGALYFSIFDGSICQRSRTPVDGWEGPIETTHPRTKETLESWVKRFDRVVARLGAVDKRKKEFSDGGKVINWNLVLIAGGKKAILQLTWMEPVLKRFLKVAPNIDFEKPLLISAWKAPNKKGKMTQRVSFRQGEGSDVQQWDKVEEYWVRPTDDDGKYDLDDPAVGPDGTVLPQLVQDPETEEWDDREQNRFLASYFVKNVKPKIDEIAERLGLNKHENSEQDAPEFSGPADGGEAKKTAPKVVTERPDNPVAASMADSMQAGQAVEIKRLLTVLGKDTEQTAQKLVGCSFHEMSQDAASYVIYRVNKLMEKKGIEAPPPPKEEKKSAPPADDGDDDDGWDDSPKAEAKSKPAPPEDDGDDDDGWDSEPAKKDDDTPF